MNQLIQVFLIIFSLIWSSAGFSKEIYYYDKDGKVGKLQVSCSERHTRAERSCDAVYTELTAIGIDYNQDNSMRSYFTYIYADPARASFFVPDNYLSCQIDPALHSEKPDILRVLTSWSEDHNAKTIRCCQLLAASTAAADHCNDCCIGDQCNQAKCKANREE